MNTKYKDRDPHETIRIARQLLSDLGIMVTEKWIYDYVELYSVRLYVEGTTFGVNGKGTTKAYALASAYGEALERLLNQLPFRVLSDIFITDEAHYIDEVRLPIDCYGDLYDAYLGTMPADRLPIVTCDDLVNYTKTRAGGDTMRCLQFQEMDSDTVLTVPADLLDVFYGSNGMAAGNTLAEACVQGLSEILERYVAKLCVEHMVTPPPLDADLYRSLDNYEQMEAYRKRIEQGGKYRVELFDLSLGQGIPAVALILYNRAEAKYASRVGVHPVLEIAVERCFTELMQGKEIENYPGMISVSEAPELLRSPHNHNRYLKNGSGALQMSFFQRAPSWEATLQRQAFSNNEDMLAHLQALIKRLGFRIFLHRWECCAIDVVFLMVPGMGDVVSHHEQSVRQATEKLCVETLIRQHVDALDRESATRILNFLEATQANGSDTLDILMRYPSFAGDNVYKETTIDLFKFRLHMILGERPRAKAALQNYAEDLRRKKRKNLFVDAYITYLSLLESDIPEREAFDILSRFYPPPIMQRLGEDVADYPLKGVFCTHCRGLCDSCTLSPNCQTAELNRIYRSISNLCRTNEKTGAV